MFTTLNFSSDEVDFEFPNDVSYSLAFGNYDEGQVDASSKTLKPWEGRIYINESA